jgi:hypothetical protein
VTAVEGSLDRSYLVVGEHMMIPLVAGICVAVDLAGRRVAVDPRRVDRPESPCRTVAVKIDLVTIFRHGQAALADGSSEGPLPVAGSMSGFTISATMRRIVTGSLTICHSAAARGWC